MLNKYLKCRELGLRPSDYLPKNLNLVEVEVNEIGADVVKDGDDEKALELVADEGEMLNCIVQKVLLASKFKEEQLAKQDFQNMCHH